MARLSNGTVVPSFLEKRDANHGFLRAMTDTSLRMGRVIAAHAPASTTNTNGLFWEYDVQCDVTNGTGSVTKIVYPRCQLMNPLGGAADRVDWTPRVGAKSNKPEGTFPLDSIVYIQCVNGNAKHPVILGGAKHPEGPTDNSSDGHHYMWEFNGAQLTVSDSGTFTLRHKGATDGFGDVISDDEKSSGAYIELGDKGSVWLQSGGDGFETVILNSQDSVVRIISSAGDVEVKATENIVLDSAGVMTGDATDYQLMGSTFRLQQQSMNGFVKYLFRQLQTALSNAGISLQVAAIANSVPIVGGQLASPAFSYASTYITTASTLAATIAQAIEEFESHSDSYLSKKNRHD